MEHLKPQPLYGGYGQYNPNRKFYAGVLGMENSQKSPLFDQSGYNFQNQVDYGFANYDLGLGKVISYTGDNM